jgi:hypothetical protein
MTKITLLSIFLFFYLTELKAQTLCEKEEFTTIANIPIYDWADSKSFYFFEAKMAIDADGSPRAYHPDNIGLDDLSYAGHEGNWWALATDNDEPNGNPIIQSENDPYPGYYVSMTALGDRRYGNQDPRRYVDAEKIPYFVLPPDLKQITGTELGDFAYIYNTKTQKGCYAIFADIGPDDKLGEGSIYLAKQLGINAHPKTGGQEKGIIYMIFPFSGNRQPRTLEEIESKGKKLMEDAKGFDFLKNCWTK